MNSTDRAVAGGLRRLGVPGDSEESDFAAWNEKEIAAHFPVPSADVADRLLDLLLPCVDSRASTGEVA